MVNEAAFAGDTGKEKQHHTQCSASLPSVQVDYSNNQADFKQGYYRGQTEAEAGAKGVLERMSLRLKAKAWA